QSMVERLARAINDHDLDGLARCFAPNYVNETPLHPARSFTGREQVRKNWQAIFAGVPDLEAEVLRCTSDGEVAWPEWEMRGTRRDGSPHLMRGVTVLGVRDDQIAWARFYLEPVEEGGSGIDATIREAFAQ
ncbi:MAG: nuclear transport factor 2 family protein, partial [Chloroflexota bacterium]